MTNELSFLLFLIFVGSALFWAGFLAAMFYEAFKENRMDDDE